MKFTVKNLQPIEVGVPTHAPKLWMMAPAKARSPLGTLDRYKRWFSRPSEDLIDQLQPVSIDRP